MPAASGRSVPQKTESPMPESGPMRADLTALIDLASNCSSLAFSSSIAVVMPMTNRGDHGGHVEELAVPLKRLDAVLPSCRRAC